MRKSSYTLGMQINKMKFNDLCMALLSRGTIMYSPRPHNYEFIHNHKVCGFCLVDEYVKILYVKNICWDTGRYEAETHNWLHEIFQ